MLSITGLTLGVENFDYSTTDDTVSGTITFGATTVSLLAGQSAFSTTISDPTGKSPTGLSGSYDINSEALSLELDEVDIKVSDILEVTADNVALNVAPDSFSMTVGSATASVPKLAGFQGIVTGLSITNDGFSIGSATLGLTCDGDSSSSSINLGSVISITDPSATITNLTVQHTTPPQVQFNGDIKVTGRSGQSEAGQPRECVGLWPFDYPRPNALGPRPVSGVGHVGRVYARELPHGYGDEPDVQHGCDGNRRALRVSTTVNAAPRRSAPLSVTASVQDFAIDASGNFVTLPGFGLSFALSDAVSQLSWPNFLPLGPASVALAWPNFSADPTNFTIDLSASIEFSLAGIELLHRAR